MSGLRWTCPPMESWTRSRSSQRSLTCRTQLRVLKLKLLLWRPPKNRASIEHRLMAMRLQRSPTWPFVSTRRRLLWQTWTR